MTVDEAGRLIYADECDDDRRLDEAILFAKTQAEAGNSDAQVLYGGMFYEGQYVEQSYAEALKWYTKAAEQENVNAMDGLGYCYYYGRSVPIDYEKAFYWYKKAADAGDLNSTYKVGDMYRYGKAVDEDPKKAYEYYSACYRNCDEFTYIWGDISRRMGDCAMYGIGREKNLEEAEGYYEDAVEGFSEKADCGDPFAPDLKVRAQEKLDECRKLLGG